MQICEPGSQLNAVLVAVTAFSFKKSACLIQDKQAVHHLVIWKNQKFMSRLKDTLAHTQLAANAEKLGDGITP